MVMRIGVRNNTRHLVDIDPKVPDDTLQVGLCRIGVRLGGPTDELVDCDICNSRAQRFSRTTEPR